MKNSRTRARICKRLRSPGIHSKEPIPPDYVALRAGTSSRVVFPARQARNRFLGSSKGLQIRAQLRNRARGNGEGGGVTLPAPLFSASASGQIFEDDVDSISSRSDISCMVYGNSLPLVISSGGRESFHPFWELVWGSSWNPVPPVGIHQLITSSLHADLTLPSFSAGIQSSLCDKGTMAWEFLWSELTLKIEV